MIRCVLFLIVLMPLFVMAGPHTKKVRKRALSKEITYPSKFVSAVKWTDNAGENIVVMTRTKKHKSASWPEDGYYEQSLEARHFLFDGKHWHRKWTVHDQVTECNKEMVVEYVEKTFAVTDLDNDGLAEVWVMYKTGCDIDVTPSYMKVMMYEGDTRYSVRGYVKLMLNENEYKGGDYTLDPDFAKAPPAFQEYALDLWKAQTEE